MNPLTLAWLNLIHQRKRFAISVAGVTFAVVLVFMQLGFLGAVDTTATILFDHFEFDLILLSTNYSNFNVAGMFPRSRLAQAYVVPEVTAVLPVEATGGQWRDPRSMTDPKRGPRRWRIFILGINPADLPRLVRPTDPPMFRNAEEMAAAQAALGRLDTFLIDRTSRPEFGDPEDLRPGATTELNEHRIELVGDLVIGTSFGYNGLLLTSEATLARTTPMPADRVTFGLVQLTPGANPVAVQKVLREVLPDDVQVLTRAQINARERHFWVSRTAVGQIFMVGVAVSVLVGSFFVYQMMTGDIRNHLAEYATIKAMGYRAWFLTAIVVSQAILLALVGFVPGVGLSLGLYQWMRYAAYIPLTMTALRIVMVLLLSIGMCLASGMLAVRIVQSSDPADLF
jgi:putative ABC transport system permease protein